MVCGLVRGLDITGARAAELQDLPAVHAAMKRVFGDLLHTAEATAKWATLIELKVRPGTDASVFRNSVLIVADDLKSVTSPRYEAIASLKFTKDFILRDSEPLATKSVPSVSIMKIALKGVVTCGDQPTK